MPGIRLLFNVSADMADIVVVKKVDEIVNNSTVLQDDDELFFSVEANKTYSMLFTVFFNITTAADFKYIFSVPTGTTIVQGRGNLSSTTPVILRDMTISTFTSGTNQPQQLIFAIKIITSSTPGVIQFQWSQSTAQIEDSTLLQGSSLVVWEELP